ncbi:VOC family protein [Stieleria varia]|uniref:Glyoxalase-like domain protein n=1 Tax=Stieleria varia TaxID=2528005 RepID=A0A5C6B1N6_9BACT|nr:VOC family protein [Stieleria varia]TWU05808.1 Glyoxalase-like domain protein [Stieleria varia]
MTNQPTFQSAFPYQSDVLSLPVTDLDVASKWYCRHFGMTEVERKESPCPSVILERDGVRIGFAINGGDASQDGAAILVNDIHSLKDEFEANGVDVAELSVDRRDGQEFYVFFVVAPDGLCYYVHEPKTGEDF